MWLPEAVRERFHAPGKEAGRKRWVLLMFALTWGSDQLLLSLLPTPLAPSPAITTPADAAGSPTSLRFRPRADSYQVPCLPLARGWVSQKRTCC